MNKVLGSQLGARIGARLSRAGRIARIAVRMNNPARAATQAKYTEGMKGGWERGKKIKPYVKYGGLAGLTYGMYRMGKLKMPGSQEREESMAYSSRNHNMTKYDKYVDLYKAARMDELEKDLYSNIGSSVARLGGKLAGSRAGSKVARGFTRFAGTKLGSKVRQYTPHIMAGAGALAGGLTASKLMARRKQKEQESQNVGKPGVNINMSQSNVDLFKLDNKQLVNRFARRMSRHFRLHGGKYGVGAGAFAMGRASKPAREKDRVQVVYKPYMVKTPTNKSSHFDNLGGSSRLTKNEKIQRAIELLDRIEKNQDAIEAKQTMNFGKFIDMIGKVQAAKILK